MTPTVITAQRLAEFLFSCGMPEPFLSDSAYALPSLDWVTGDGGRAIFNAVCRNVGNYESEIADCDDFAFAAAAEVRRLHRVTMRGSDEHPLKPCAIAWGLFPYIRENGTAHCINIFVHREGDGEPLELRLGFFEPQPAICRVVELTPKEIQSCVAPQF